MSRFTDGYWRDLSENRGHLVAGYDSVTGVKRRLVTDTEGRLKTVSTGLDPSGGVIEYPANGTAFITTTALGAGVQFQSAWLDARNYTQVQTQVLASHDGTMLFEFGTDSGGTDIIRSLTVPYVASDGYRLFGAPVFSDYIRYSFTNNALVIQTDFFYSTRFYNTAQSPQQLAVDAFVSPAMISSLSRSVITALDPNGLYVNAQADLKGHLIVDSGKNTGYNERLSMTITPLIEVNHNYGIAVNPQHATTVILPGGTVTSPETGVARLENDGTAGGAANIKLKRQLRFTAGSHYEARSICKFYANTPSSLVVFVLGGSETSWSFAHFLGAFGVLKLKDGKQNIATFEVTTAATTAAAATVTLNGVPYTANLTNAGGDKNFTAFEIAHRVNPLYQPDPALPLYDPVFYLPYGDWLVESVGDTVYFLSQNLDARNGTYSFTHVDALCTATQTRVGVATDTSEFIAQADWNGNSHMVTDLNPLVWNVYSILWSSQRVVFGVVSSISGEIETVHTMDVANTETIVDTPTSFAQHLVVEVAGFGGLGAVTLDTAGTTVLKYEGIEGTILVPTQSISVTKTGITTERVLMALNARCVVNNEPNEADFQLSRIFVTQSTGNKTAIIKIILNPTTLSADSTADYVDWQFVNETSSLILFDTNSLTYTGGQELLSFAIAVDAGLDFDFTGSLNINIAPDDIVIVTAQSSNATDIDMTILCRENP